MARKRNEGREDANTKRSSGSKASTHKKVPSKTTERKAERRRLGGWGIFLLSIIAICLVVNVGINIVSKIDERQPVPEPTIDMAAVASQAANILNVPTFAPLTTETTDDPNGDGDSLNTQAPAATGALPTATRVEFVQEPLFDFASIQNTGDTNADYAIPTLGPTVRAVALSTAPVAGQTLMASAPTATAAIATATPTQKPTAAPSDTATPRSTPSTEPTTAPTVKPTYGKSTVERLNIREEPDTHADRVALIEREGRGMMIFGSTEDKDGETWYIVNYGRHNGYVLAKYVEEITEEEFGPIATRSSRSGVSSIITIAPTATSKSTTAPSISDSAQSAASSHSPVTGPFIGDVKTREFHVEGCILLPSQSNRVELPSRAIAIANGFSPCATCMK